MCWLIPLLLHDGFTRAGESDLKAHASIQHSSNGTQSGGVRPILLVDPDPGLRETRRLLLTRIRSPVEAVGSSLEVFRLPPQSSYGLVAISLSAGLDEVSHVALYVRHRWPEAKIMLLGEISEGVDDPLYDERVDSPCNPWDLAEVSRRLLGIRQSAASATVDMR